MTPLYESTLTDEIATVLKNGGVGVLRTDTLYGIVGRADSEKAVERIYDIKTRTPSKSPIVLIADVADMFDDYDETITAALQKVWPAKSSIILPSRSAPQWLVRGNESVAYRIPASEALREFLRKTGPLIAPSANPEGEAPAMTVEEAKQYFGDQVDFYVDGGRVTDDSPSKLYRLTTTGMERLR